ncbi:DUF4197 domain-containing protein [Erythrobacter litoralis]|uniref:DUF4197 domain-containing protein n=1 Tax=Erythrobacter litoralis (strain HTCC2594) TaxID=314225 RepID=Q2N907_ERYLH|nr:DUF4197 domain-containing protein [Erythrobacter litoralis]ABC63834.1 hypothetical protein ELI_08710 [Erythrobacter litoralis HTCC2594]
MSKIVGSEIITRRSMLAGLGASSLVLLPGCAGGYGGGFSFTEAIRRLLLLSSERAFDRLTAPGGYWDDQVARIGLGSFLGTRGDVLSRILTSALFKDRLEGVFADFAIDASERAAPVVADAVRVIGFQNAIDLVRGGPSAATDFLSAEVGTRVLDAMVPGLDRALRVAEDPLVGQALGALTGVDVGGVANRLGTRVSDAIWAEMGREEAAIRAHPRATRDPLLIGVFGAASRL